MSPARPEGSLEAASWVGFSSPRSCLFSRSKFPRQDRALRQRGTRAALALGAPRFPPTWQGPTLLSQANPCLFGACRAPGAFICPLSSGGKHPLGPMACWMVCWSQDKNQVAFTEEVTQSRGSELERQKRSYSENCPSLDLPASFPRDNRCYPVTCVPDQRYFPASVNRPVGVFVPF